MKKKITIVDIARKLGITPSAVSKAFSDHPRISRATKKAVTKAARELGYYRNSLATGLRKGKSGLIGVLVPGIEYSFFANAIKGAEEILSSHGYSVIIAQSRDNFDTEKKHVESFIRVHVEGIIASLAIATKDYHHYIEVNKTIPVVLFDRTFENADISTVTIDDYSGAVKAVEHLIEMGYRRIAHIGGYKHVQPFRKRMKGYKSVLKKYGLPVREDYIFQCAPNKDEGAKVANMLLDLEVSPDAIFAASDYLALGAIKAVFSRGLLVPENIGVVGFSNEEISSQVSPPITTLDQFSETMGAAAARLLIHQIRQSSPETEFATQKRILTPQLIVRDSSVRLVQSIYLRETIS